VATRQVVACIVAAHNLGVAAVDSMRRLGISILQNPRGVTMSNKSDVPNNLNHPGRREIMQAAGAAILAGMAGSTLS
jgi:hypothetical protein